MAGGIASPVPLLVKSKDFTTHAVIIGMTGSGKTGLGIGLIEEAIMDNIPSIVIDPKGDMGNLMLTFPELRPADFLPWLDPADAAKKELSVEAYAEQTAGTWEQGLQSWGQGKERIQRLRERTTLTIYTPGSSAGVSISVLSSFKAPAKEVTRDTDTLNDLVNSTVTSLLSLIGVKGDPLQSREHILLCSIFLYFWRQGQDLTLESLIGTIVNPPFTKIGVFSLDTFYAQSERMQLAMSLNNILASPSFAAWTKGEPLDIQRLLYNDDGKPKTAIFSIAHLSESERMFFVTMLLNQFVGWRRRQQGTSSLKALLYMDEIFGYFPPTANPPSKKPMLLLLKQARAYGVGVVLATQNPVDLDYKGLSNIGTWIVGRLQTTQDQERVVEGIVGASDGRLNRGQAETVSGMNDHPPMLSDDIDQYYYLQNMVGEGAVFEPWLAARSSVRFYNASRNLDEVKQISRRLYLDEAFGRPDWGEAEENPCLLSECILQPPSGSSFYPLPAVIAELTDLRSLQKDFAEYLYQNMRLKLLPLNRGEVIFLICSCHCSGK